MTQLASILTASPYRAYTYAYPHKTAYRTLAPAVPLQTAWAQEDKRNLFLYLHIPFCEMRCGFCNLFTTVNPEETLEKAYLSALERQARVVRQALGEAAVSRVAIGGGTPTYLAPGDLERLLDIVRNVFGANLAQIPSSIETSPATVTPERLQVLKSAGIERVSMGVQSFIEAEARAAGRPQRTAEVRAALEHLSAFSFPVLNLDLIYGLPGQTPQSWRTSLAETLSYAPQEVFLYPLYVRPLTGLARTEREWDDDRLTLYRIGRDYLRERGYEQVSMRLFRRVGVAGPMGAPSYDCQTDGMVGLGCGARSYTRTLHYSSEYAVGQPGVKAILNEYVRRSDAEFAEAAHGMLLNADEQRRRFILQSVLHASGLSADAYHTRFGTHWTHDHPELLELVTLNLAQQRGDLLTLTDAGFERSDAIGPWLYSGAVQHRTQAYEWH
ncbi:STM4012 family radical SAM protein [Deinococcus ruber]|uniref:Coproporphyrinogen III oxidase n=1 Tax=Deinococcus ruber TaxID=1848197 RepID=A0A918BWJ3_9DEIO|nr:STM4012 family radical SAM protein [Deinococcus ruber]GGQ94168.1 coproporphyrinogen III oxidase [Deinococcus ruber]